MSITQIFEKDQDGNEKPNTTWKNFKINSLILTGNLNGQGNHTNYANRLRSSTGILNLAIGNNNLTSLSQGPNYNIDFVDSGSSISGGDGFVIPHDGNYKVSFSMTIFSVNLNSDLSVTVNQDGFNELNNKVDLSIIANQNVPISHEQILNYTQGTELTLVINSPVNNDVIIKYIMFNIEQM